VSDTFEANWLAMREPFDHASVSRRVAQRLIATLPRRPHLLDLGAGSGSMFRWLAPLIERAQTWTLADRNEALLGEAFTSIAAWGDARGCTVTWPRRALVLHTPGGAWRVEGLLVDLAQAPARLPLADVSAVVCSALLDLVSAAWLDRLAAALRSPFLACLTVDGRDAWLPPHPTDRMVRTGFRRDQARDKGFGPALGPRAVTQALRTFSAHGFEVTSAASDWRVPRTAARMLTEFLLSTAEAAGVGAPRHAASIKEWQARRFRQIAVGRLAVRIGHKDILALPRTLPGRR